MEALPRSTQGPRGRSGHSGDVCVGRAGGPGPGSGVGVSGLQGLKATPVLSAFPSSAGPPVLSVPPPPPSFHLPMSPPTLSLSPELPGDSGLSVASRSSQRLGGLPGLPHPVKIPSILLGSPVRSVSGLLGFTNLAQLPKPAMILTTLLEYPELASVPPTPFCQYPSSCHRPPPPFCQGSLSL